MLRLTFLVLVLALFHVQAGRYENHELVKLTPQSLIERASIEQHIRATGIDVWKTRKDGPMDLLLEAEEAAHLREQGYTLHTMQHGQQIDQLVFEQTEFVTARGPNGYDFDDYNNLTLTYAFFDHIVAMHGDIATVTILGQSSLGVDIQMLTLTSNGTAATAPLIVIEAGIHGREWVGPHTCIDLLHTLIHHSELYDGIRYAFIPVLNVDGYKYSWESTDRFWRKSRTAIDSDVCEGIDPNRNFELNFGGEGASDLACSDYYSGSEALDEPVTALLENYLDAEKDQLLAYISLHGYGQTIMYPWSSQATDIANIDELNQIALDAADSLESRNGTLYSVGAVSQLYDLKSGTSYDYAQSLGVPFVYTIELRDTGEYGYLLPADQLSDVSAEVTLAVEVIVNAALASLDE